ncbi:MAG: gliding motility lipoprotein GldH, partial [Tannerella sp.]|nr:gliding motility lipoprotein GldH [Tannerella sp.]
MRTGSLGNNITVIIITASCLCFSCGSDTVYNKFQPVRGKVWDKQSAYYFKFEVKDRSIPYHILLQTRNSDMYRYQNLWLLCEELQPGGVSVKDTA